MAEPDQPQQTEEGPLPHTHEAVDLWLNKWGRQEVAAGNEPLTRQDVVGLIEVNGGTAMALDLVGRDLHGSDLSSLDLKRANLRRAHLEGADLDNGAVGGSTPLVCPYAGSDPFRGQPPRCESSWCQPAGSRTKPYKIGACRLGRGKLGGSRPI